MIPALITHGRILFLQTKKCCLVFYFIFLDRKNNMIEHVVEKMKEADLVLVGLGEELDLLKTIKKSEKYNEITKRVKKDWVLPFVEKLMLEDTEKEKIEIYKILAEILEKKNYFVISVCQDGIIRQAGFRQERIVEPCGSYHKLQCSEKCSMELYDVPKEIPEQIRAFMNGEKTEAELKQPICPVCGKTLVFNNSNAENYLEEGYLDQWMIYKKWLQGTVNKNLCILEIGVGMKYPTVIRWPFERVAFFNQKAELFRVHSWLYQITEEIKEKGYGICQNPEEFIRELSKNF